jgi:hypothetical protein
MILGLFTLALITFIVTAYLYGRSKLIPPTLQALGLGFIALGIIVFLSDKPEPIPPTPIPTTDTGAYRPHYQGHGVLTSGGRGGEIRRVINGETLVSAVRARNGCVNTAATCARTIIFDASGNYDIGGQLTIDSPFITIAAQTAPNDGASLINTRFLIDTHDVVVQHLKVRLPPQSLNACSLGDAGDGGDNGHVYNIVLDHVTCTWANEVNNLLVAAPNSHDIAILDSLIGEGLWPNALGGIGMGVGYKNTVKGNIITEHWSRQPIWGSPGELALLGNLIYNGTDNSHGYDTLPAFFGDADGDGSNGSLEQTVILNNVLIPGPNSGQVAAILGISKKKGSIDAGSKIYMSGNQGPLAAANSGNMDDQWIATICVGTYGNYTNAATCGSKSNMRTDSLFQWFIDFKFTIPPTSEVFSSVLSKAGARPKNRDSADLRMIADIQNRTGTHYLSRESVSMPVLISTTRACNLPSNPLAEGSRTLKDGSKNTVLEDYLENDATCGAKRLE